MCHEDELLGALRYVVEHPDDTDSARRLLERIDEENDAVRRYRDPYGEQP